MNESNPIQNLLPPAVDLEVDPRELTRVRALSAFLAGTKAGGHHPLLGTDQETWQQENDRLATVANAGDVDALATLVKRDPRLLGHPAVQVKLMLWKLERHFVGLNRPESAEAEKAEVTGTIPEERARQRSVRAAEAAENLRKLGRAAQASVGSGKQGLTEPFRFLEAFEDVQRRVLSAADLVRNGSNLKLKQKDQLIQRVAKQASLPEDEIRQLLQKPDATAETIHRIVAATYGRDAPESERWSRGMIKAAREAVADAVDDEGEERT